jgi:hypothetical protein
LLHRDGLKRNQWIQELQRSEEMRGRMRSFGPGPSLPVKDPLSGATFDEEPWYITLADPSGMPVTGAPQARSLAPAPPAATLSICRDQLSSAERTLAAMKRAIDRDLPPRERWLRAPPNAALTAEEAAMVRQNLALPPGSTAVAVDCRGRVCRLDVDRRIFPDDRYLARLETPDFRRRHINRGMTHAWNVYYERAPADATAGGDLVQRALDELLASPALDACETRYAPSGGIEIQIRVPATGDEESMTVQIGGALAGSVFARCLEAVLTDIVAHTPLPAKVTATAIQRRVEFPRPKSAAAPE